MTETKTEKKSSALLWTSGVISIALVVAAIGVYEPHELRPKSKVQADSILISAWNDLGSRLVKEGVIDKDKFLALYAKHPEMQQEAQKLLSPAYRGPLEITAQNQPVVLNILWALGLGNANPVLESKAMRSHDTGRFASTGGWTLAHGMPMDHYGKHGFIPLSAEQQKLVEEVSKNIYRPCCNNPTSMPDCNHGMALLGLLEALAFEGATEEEMYATALITQRYWFSDTYQKIDAFIAQESLTVTPKEILGTEFSSGTGIARVSSQLRTAPQPRQGGGGCSV
jgi:hypothetical protein